jgi:hypothetical protein
LIIEQGIRTKWLTVNIDMTRYPSGFVTEDDILQELDKALREEAPNEDLRSWRILSKRYWPAERELEIRVSLIQRTEVLA